MTEARRRNMALVGLIGFSSYFAYGQYIVLPLHLERFGMEAGEIGVVLSSLFLSAMLVRPFIGMVVPRLGLRRLAILSSLLWVATTPVFLLLTPGCAWVVYLLRVLQGVGLAGLDLVITVVPSDLAPAGRRAQGIGSVSLFFIIGLAISPVVAEWTLGLWGVTVPFVLSGVSGAMALAGSLGLRLPARPSHAGSYRIHIVDAWKTTVDRQLCVLCLVVFIGVGLAEGAYGSFVPLYAQASGAGAGSLFFLIGSLASAAARALFSGLSDRWGRRRVLIPSFLAMMMAPAFLFDLRSGAFLAAAGLAHGLGIGLFMPAALASVTEKRRAGSDASLSIGVFYTAFDGGAWVGSSVFGYFAQMLGFGVAFLTLVFFALVGLGLVLGMGEKSLVGRADTDAKELG